MLDFDKYKEGAIAALGAILLTATTLVASVGPARVAETTPVLVAHAQTVGAINA